MTREVRMVPANWEHPTDGYYPDGSVRYDPLFDGDTFADRAAQWDADAEAWQQGVYPDVKDEHRMLSFEEFEGPRPDPAHYMPLWDVAERTHYMMYELSTEGTPISPAFDSAEALAHWMFENRNDAWAGQKLTLQEWKNVCTRFEKPAPTVFKKTPFD